MKTIGLFNPSSPVYTDVDLKKLETFFPTKGFHFVQSQNLWQKNRFLAGTDEQRASDIMDLFCDILRIRRISRERFMNRGIIAM